MAETLADPTIDEPVTIADDAAAVAADAAVDSSLATDQGGEPAPEVVAEPDDDAGMALINFARETIGERPWLEKYKDPEAFVRGFDELQRKIGERDNDAATIQWLQQQGVTRDDLLKLVESRRQPAAESGNGQPKTQEWDKSWVAQDAEGKMIPTASGRAALGDKLEARYLEHQQHVLQQAEDIPSLVKAAIAEMMPELTKQASQQAQQQTSQWQEQQAMERFAAENENVLFAGGKKDASGQNWTPLAYRVSDLVKNELNPAIPLQTRLQKAMKIAVAENKPTPATKVVPNTAIHKVTPAAGAAPKKMNLEQFTEKWPDRYISLQEFDAWFNGGQMDGPLPKKPPKQ